METQQQLFLKLKVECFDLMQETYGCQFIFNKRAQWYGKIIKLLKVFGIGVPGLAGFAYIAHEYFICLDIPIRYTAIGFMGVQFLFSICAIIWAWDEELSYAYEASQAYNSLYEGFNNLYKFPPVYYGNFNIEYEKLLNEFTFRSQQDGKHDIKEWEKRRGWRYTIRQHRQKCAGTGKCTETAPISLQSTDCPVCGRFSLIYKLF